MNSFFWVGGAVNVLGLIASLITIVGFILKTLKADYSKFFFYVIAALLSFTVGAMPYRVLFSSEPNSFLALIVGVFGVFHFVISMTAAGIVSAKLVDEDYENQDFGCYCALIAVGYLYASYLLYIAQMDFPHLSIIVLLVAVIHAGFTTKKYFFSDHEPNWRGITFDALFLVYLSILFTFFLSWQSEEFTSKINSLF